MTPEPETRFAGACLSWLVWPRTTKIVTTAGLTCSIKSARLDRPYRAGSVGVGVKVGAGVGVGVTVKVGAGVSVAVGTAVGVGGMRVGVAVPNRATRAGAQFATAHQVAPLPLTPASSATRRIQIRIVRIWMGCLVRPPVAPDL